MVNLAGSHAGQNELSFIYSDYPTGYGSAFRDITSSGSETTVLSSDDGWGRHDLYR